MVSSNSFPHYKSICSKCLSYLPSNWMSDYLPWLSLRNCFCPCNSKYINDTDESNKAVAPPNHKKVRAIIIQDQNQYHKYDHWPILIDIPNTQRTRWKDVKGKQCLLALNAMFTFALIKAHTFWNFMESK